MIEKSTKRMFVTCCAMVAGLATSLVAMTGCQPHEGSEDQLKADVDSFATLYYNWHFPKAVKYCTPASERWLRYAASNVHPADIELLRQKPEDATIEITDVNFGDDEVSAVVTLTVSNFLQMDTIGQEAHLIPLSEVQLPMQLHGDKWKVKLDRLP